MVLKIKLNFFFFLCILVDKLAGLRSYGLMHTCNEAHSVRLLETSAQCSNSLLKKRDE